MRMQSQNAKKKQSDTQEIAHDTYENMQQNAKMKQAKKMNH